MSVLPPSWAMGAVGIDGAGDPHLARGIHLRVVSAPQMGLPIRPFVVYRLIGEDAQRRIQGSIHRDLVWVDSRGRVLSPPFEVKPDNPVTGHVPRQPGRRCIGVVLVTSRSSGFNLTHLSMAHLSAERAVARPTEAGKLRMEGFVETPEGRRILAERNAAPYRVAASELHGVVLRGSGLVQGAVWIGIDVTIVEKLEPSFFLDLPVKGAARYEGLPDAEDRAKKRVLRGAPQRFGLHDDPSVAGPLDAAPATEEDEWKRVRPLADEIAPSLDRVLNDLSALPAALGDLVGLTDGVQPGAHAEAEVACLRAVLAGTADPGVGRWLGFLDVDLEPAVLSAPLALYFVRGFFAVDFAPLDLVERLSLLVSGGRLLADLPPGPLPFAVPAVSPDGLPVFDFTVAFVVFPGAPPARPSAPGIGAPLAPAVQVGPGGAQPPATSDGLGPWLPDVLPPQARREVVLPLAGLEGAPTLAAARRDGAGLHSLNERHPASGRALALLPAVPSDAIDTGTGRLSDREVPPEAVRFRVAQADWFGRWSGWAERDVPAKERPAPPAPVFEVHYQPAPATPLDDAPRFGTLRVRLNVPRIEALAPGSRLLQAGRVEAIIGGVSVSASAALPSPTQPSLDILVPGPAGMIGRAEQVVARVNARWNDGVQDGPLGDAQEKVLVDPRPPRPVTLDPTLRYSARPDAVGRSRFVLEWNATTGVRYRVYTTDETRLRGALLEMALAGDTVAQGLLDDIDGIDDPALRAMEWSQPARAGLFVRELFTNLNAEPLVATSTGPMRFSHDLSGSLRVLAFYKVVSLSSSNVESPFTQATLLPVGVPSGGPPPRPLLDFVEWTDTGAARLRVTTVRGPQPASRWRLRRSFASSDDALRMPIVAGGNIPAPTDEGPVVFEILDEGSDALAGGALRPWTRTSWRVEVQAPTLPGSTLPGEWSPASGPAGGMRIPPIPSAPTDLSIEPGGPADIRIAWKHPESLQKGSQGSYRFDLYRRLPGDRETRAGSVLADDPTAVTGSGAGRTFRFTESITHPAGTSWRVVVLDPAGRLSPPSSPVTWSGAP